MNDAWFEEGRSRIPCDRPIQHTHCVLLVERCWDRSELHLLTVLLHSAFTKSSATLRCRLGTHRLGVCDRGWRCTRGPQYPASLWYVRKTPLVRCLVTYRDASQDRVVL